MKILPILMILALSFGLLYYVPKTTGQYTLETDVMGDCIKTFCLNQRYIVWDSETRHGENVYHVYDERKNK